MCAVDSNTGCCKTNDTGCCVNSYHNAHSRRSEGVGMCQSFPVASSSREALMECLGGASNSNGKAVPPLTPPWAHGVTTCVSSLGRVQVYKAVLRDTGEEVAVKVQRPGIEPVILRDLFVFRALGSLFNTLSRQVRLQ